MPKDKLVFTGKPNSRADLRSAIDVANVPTLLLLLVQLTGETKWIDAPYEPSRARGLDDNDTGGLPSDIQAEIRSAALEAILRWQDGAPVAVPTPSAELLSRMMTASFGGEEISPEYGELILEEIGLDPDDDPKDFVIPEGFRVVIVGGGFSGLAAAVRFEKAGIPYTIYEKADRAGGVWLENRYPSVGVDTPSHLYSFSYAPYDWSRYFAEGHEVRNYIEWVATRYGVHDKIQFETEVLSAEFSEESGNWIVSTRRSDGSEESITATIVISCVGAFHPPVIPDIPGLPTFGGELFHSAAWPDGVDLRGKRVAVVGNGASAMQLVPAIADEVESLTVFQRAPHWAAPFDKLKVPVPDRLRFLMQNVSLYQMWYRARLSWMYMDRVHSSLQKDPSWPHPERSVNRVNDGHRKFFSEYIKSELGGREDLISQLTPTYPPYGKRILLDNGWYRTFLRPNAELVSDRIGEITESGIVTADGRLREFDIIVFATGYDAGRFLSTISVRGRLGQTLDEEWAKDGPRAYLGLSVPHFPNFFMLYGPNAQIGHGGSLIMIAENQMNYIMDFLQQFLATGSKEFQLKPEVYEEYNRRVDSAHEKMVWTHPGMSTYYRNAAGRVVVVNPWRALDFWKMTRRADLNDFEFEPPRARARTAA